MRIICKFAFRPKIYVKRVEFSLCSQTLLVVVLFLLRFPVQFFQLPHFSPPLVGTPCICCQAPKTKTCAFNGRPSHPAKPCPATPRLLPCSAAVAAIHFKQTAVLVCVCASGCVLLGICAEIYRFILDISKSLSFNL